jgi:hypothetical protein
MDVARGSGALGRITIPTEHLISGGKVQFDEEDVDAPSSVTGVTEHGPVFCAVTVFVVEEQVAGGTAAPA